MHSIQLPIIWIECMKCSRFYRSHDNWIFGPQMTPHSWWDDQFATGTSCLKRVSSGSPARANQKSRRNDFYQEAWPQWSVWPTQRMSQILVITILYWIEFVTFNEACKNKKWLKPQFYPSHNRGWVEWTKHNISLFSIC